MATIENIIHQGSGVRIHSLDSGLPVQTVYPEASAAVSVLFEEYETHLSTPFGRTFHPIAKYAKPVEIEAPPELPAPDFAHLIGEAAAAKLYVLEYLTVGVTDATADDGATARAQSQLESYNSGLVMLIEGDGPLTEVQLNRRDQILQHLVDRNVPTACISAFSESTAADLADREAEPTAKIIEAAAV